MNMSKNNPTITVHLKLKIEEEKINLVLHELKPLTKESIKVHSELGIPQECPLCNQRLQEKEYVILIYEDLGRFPTCLPHTGCIQNGALLAHLNTIYTKLGETND